MISLTILLIILQLNSSENVSSSLFTYNEFPLSSGARCLDGSNYGAYFSSGEGTGKYSILISFWGGGWCGGLDRNSFLDSCLERANSNLGSSKTWQKTPGELYGLLSSDPEKNPNFYNWNRFDIPYCDGSGHQGYVQDPINYKDTNLYFRGHKNVLTALQWAISQVGSKYIDKFVVSGCSAGGLATFNWTQYISDYLANLGSKAQVYGIPDSGFFVDHLNQVTKDFDYRKSMQQLYLVVNQEVAPISTECLKDHKGEEYMCLFAQNLSNYIKTPFLMEQPGYDSWQIDNILGENCADAGSISKCSKEQQVNLQEYKKSQNTLIKQILAKKPNMAVWCPACLKHCFGQDDLNSTSWAVPDASGNTINKAIEKFMKAGMDQTGNRDMDDEVDWPDNKGCANVKAKFCYKTK